MNTAAQQVRELFFQLPEDERGQLLQELQSEGGFELSEKEKNEIRRRIEEHRRDPSTAISREELMAKMLATDEAGC